MKVIPKFTEETGIATYKWSVADYDACAEGIAKVEADLGPVDILVNNAGINPALTPLSELTEAYFDKLCSVNLKGPIRLATLVAPRMGESGGGSIINIASIFGLVGSGSIPQASYVASKGALVNLTRELGAQWARRGVRVNAIAPAFFPSEMTDEMFDDERSMSWLRRKTPAGRPGAVRELDGALVGHGLEAPLANRLHRRIGPIERHRERITRRGENIPTTPLHRPSTPSSSVPPTRPSMLATLPCHLK